jgi:hypothetical protein
MSRTWRTSGMTTTGMNNRLKDHGKRTIGKIWWLICAGVSLALLNACEKENPNYRSRITLWNAVPNSNGFDITAGSEVHKNLLFNQPGYNTGVGSGTLSFSWGKTGASAADSLFVTDLKAGADYSLLFFDSLGKYRTYFTRDHWQQTPQEGKTFVRFFAMIIGGDALTVENDTGRVIIGTHSFADFGLDPLGLAFAPIDSLTNKLRLVQGSGSGRRVLDSITNVRLEEGRSYSFYASGVIGNTGTAKPRLFMQKHE